MLSGPLGKGKGLTRLIYDLSTSFLVLLPSTPCQVSFSAALAKPLVLCRLRGARSRGQRKDRTSSVEAVMANWAKGKSKAGSGKRPGTAGPRSCDGAVGCLCYKLTRWDQPPTPPPPILPKSHHVPPFRVTKPQLRVPKNKGHVHMGAFFLGENTTFCDFKGFQQDSPPTWGVRSLEQVHPSLARRFGG